MWNESESVGQVLMGSIVRIVSWSQLPSSSGLSLSLSLRRSQKLFRSFLKRTGIRGGYALNSSSSAITIFFFLLHGSQVVFVCREKKGNEVREKEMKTRIPIQNIITFVTYYDESSWYTFHSFLLLSIPSLLESFDEARRWDQNEMMTLDGHRVLELTSQDLPLLVLVSIEAYTGIYIDSFQGHKYYNRRMRCVCVRFSC